MLYNTYYSDRWKPTNDTEAGIPLPEDGRRYVKDSGDLL